MAEAPLPQKHVLPHIPNSQAIRKVLNVILFPLVFWALIVFSRELPSYLLRMSAWDIAGVLAYVLVVALLDSIILLFILVTIYWLIPARWQRLTFEAWGALLAMGIIVTIMVYHIRTFFTDKIPALSAAPYFWILPAIAVILVIALSYRTKYSGKIESMVGQIHERVDLISGLFLVMICTGLLIVLIRNLGLH